MDVKIKQYETTVVEFVRKDGGHLLIASNDHTFVRVVRNTVNKQLAIEDDCITAIVDENKIIKAIKEIGSNKKRILLFIERVFNNKETSFLVKQVKNAFNNVKIIVLTGEADRQRLVLLHEIGADNFISKPISINTLIEKIAFTIKPQGKIGKLIDMGKLLNEQGSFDKALQVARQVLEIKPNSAAAFLIMGDAYKGQDKDDKSVEAYEEASRNAPMYLEPLKKLANLFEERDDPENQLHYLEKLDRLSPLNVERKVDMGGIHMDLGNEDQAEELFDGALKQAHREAMTYIEEISTKIGDIYTRTDPEKAEKYYRKALEAKGDMLDQSDIRTFNQLGIALRKQGKWKEAIEEYKKAQKVSPEDENLFYNIAMAQAEGKQYVKAGSNLDSALKLNPDFYKLDPVIAYNFGLIYSKAKDTEKARGFLEYAVQAKPDFESPRKLLQKLG
jgi:tetratricopeptide (TPR) repeat protein